MNDSFASRRLVDISFAGGLILVLGVVAGVDRLIIPPPQGSGSGGRGLLQPESIYELRVAENKEELVLQFGGTKESEAAVAAALDWLARHQAKDGSWSNRYLTNGPQRVCDSDPHCRGGGGDFPFAQTGLALLALQAAGHFDFEKAEYSEHVRRGLDWLVDQQKKDGGLYGDSGRTYMYEHGIATFALAEACAIARAFKREPNKRYLDAAERAVEFIESQQHDDGGWRYTDNKGARSDTSVSGWSVLALKSAREAGIPIDKGVIPKVREFFKSCEGLGQNGRTGYQGRNPHTEATTGVGMLVHQFLLDSPDSQLVRDAAPFLADLAEATWGGDRGQKPDYYLWYNCTLAMHTVGGPAWERWNNVVRDLVIGLQEPDEAGCARGSWPPSSHWGGQGGRIYTTALGALILEVYYRFAKVEKH
jgi:hypothetical protein